MTDYLDRLQKAWQSQCSKPLDVNPDRLLKSVRDERRVYFLVDMFVIGVFLCAGAWTSWSAIRDIRKDWPWLFYILGCTWVVVYILYDRWRRRRFAAHYDDSLLAHVEWSIKDIEHRMRLDRNTLWWYILPIALGCMIPPVIFFAMDYSNNPELGDLFALLVSEGFFVAVFYFVYWVMKNARRAGLDRKLKELEALRALRENLLNEGAPQ